MYREMGMRFWLEQAEAEMKALGWQSGGVKGLFGDVRAARYHSMQEPAQVLYSQRLALGLDVNN
jgi:hypothetical protein